MREFRAFIITAFNLSMAALSYILDWSTAPKVVWTFNAILTVSLMAAVLAYHERQWRDKEKSQ